LPKPFIIGCDLGGVVEAVGANVTLHQVGDRVWGTNQGLMGRQGTFAEYCAVDEQWLYRTPDNVDDKAVAACALVSMTAHLGLFREARLESGECVFVQGGSGGVGSAVVQMAKAVGARVIASAGSDVKATRCKQLGADDVVNYHTPDLSAAVRGFAPDGVNVVWETQREPDFDVLVSLMAERGRLILMAGRDARPPFPVGPFYVKGCSLHGFAMFKATADEQRTCANDINRWLEEGKLRAQIGREMSLAEAAAAHRLQEESTLQRSGGLTGKIVLTVG
jgi:NADPH2:quinone reductase